MRVTCVILAAGESRRMGRPKLLLPFAGSTLLDRAYKACAGFETAIVTSSEVAASLDPTSAAAVIYNGEPERGMTHSLLLADARIAPDRALLVLPGDLPFIDAALVALVAGADPADVAYPMAGESPAHPVRFGVAARARLRLLPQGDTLRTLRDDPDLSRTIVARVDPRTQRDVDDPAAYDGALAQLHER